MTNYRYSMVAEVGMDILRALLCQEGGAEVCMAAGAGNALFAALTLGGETAAAAHVLLKTLGFKGVSVLRPRYAASARALIMR
jgi:hypothetical protein